MKVRVKFTKTGPVKYIGHLDVMRYFQKALRRAGLKMKLSEGFSPHPLMSFAQPLALGDTSESEYMDVVLTEAANSADMVDALNAQMAEGIEVLSLRLLADDAKNAMSATSVIDSLVFFRPGMEPDYSKLMEYGINDSITFFSKMADFLGNDEIIITRQGKKGEVSQDVKPFLIQTAIKDSSFFLRADVRHTYVNPKHIVQAYAKTMGIDVDIRSIASHRIELYTFDENENMISLEDVGAEF